MPLPNRMTRWRSCASDPVGPRWSRPSPWGSFPAEVEGPHGVSVDPDGRHWYVSIAHGFPYGAVHKYETTTDAWVGDVGLGLFPATLDVSPSTGLLFAVNFNLHGPLEPSSISVVEVETMTEVARIDTGIRPHGGRLSRDGSYFYSVNMMDFELVELDAFAFEITRRLSLGEGVMPSWVTRPTPDGMVYVTGNNVARVFEVDLESWRVQRIFETGAGPYNLDVTPDGATLVATYKGGNAVGFWNLEQGTETARTETSRTIPHGVAVTPRRRVRLRNPRGRRFRSRHRRGLPCGHRRTGCCRRHRQAGRRSRVLEDGRVERSSATPARPPAPPRFHRPDTTLRYLSWHRAAAWRTAAWSGSWRRWRRSGGPGRRRRHGR